MRAAGVSPEWGDDCGTGCAAFIDQMNLCEPSSLVLQIT